MDSNQPIAAPVVGDIKSAVSLLRKALKGAPKADAEWTGALKAKVDGNKAKLAGKMTAETPSGMMNYSDSWALFVTSCWQIRIFPWLTKALMHSTTLV